MSRQLFGNGFQLLKQEGFENTKLKFIRSFVVSESSRRQTSFWLTF
ncbi:unnamed protein product [Brassica oleracea var. botrytis]